MIFDENILNDFFTYKDDGLQEFINKDREIILRNYYKKVTLLTSTDKEELENIYMLFSQLRGVIVDFDLLPFYYEVAFCLNYRKHKILNAVKYLRSLKTCINKFYSLDNHEAYKIEDMEKIRSNYRNYIKLINLEYNYQELGERDLNIKFYLPEIELKELLEKEITIRCLMRKAKINRCEATSYLLSIKS